MKTYLKTDLAWAAGFIDGEGSIDVHRDKKGCFHVRLIATQANEQVLLHMKSIFRCGNLTKKHIVGPRRQSWDWKVNGQNAGTVLRLIHRFLRFKGKQAELALKLCREQEGHRQGVHLNEEQIAKRLGIVNEYKALKGAL